jgi:hypothetical protein
MSASWEDLSLDDQEYNFETTLGGYVLQVGKHVPYIHINDSGNKTAWSDIGRKWTMAK